jgi:cytochrome c biogenesis protein ResB
MIPQISSSSASSFTSWQAKSSYSYQLVTLLQLNRIFTSYWFLLLVLFLLFAISISLHGQFKKARSLFNAKPSGKFSPQVVLKAGQFPTDTLRATWARKGFKTEGWKNGSMVLLNFSKYRRNVWGSFIFHGGILVIISASLLTFAYQKDGFVQLIEGDTFSGQEAGFLSTSKGILAGVFEPEFEIHLNKFSHSFWDTGELKEVKSDVTIDRRGVLLNTNLLRGQSLSVNGVNIYQSANVGYTLKISLLAGERGEQAVPTYFSLDMAPAGKPLMGKSDFPTTDYLLDINFFPDSQGRSSYLVDPSLQVRFLKGEREVGRAELKPGDEVLVEKSRFRFEEIRPWSGLILTGNRFMPLVYAGFLINAAGIFMMFLFNPQEILVSAVAEEEGFFSVAVAVRTRMGSKILLDDTVEALRELLGRESGKG